MPCKHLLAVAAQASNAGDSNGMDSAPKLETESSRSPAPFFSHKSARRAASFKRPVVVSWCTAARWVKPPRPSSSATLSKSMASVQSWRTARNPIPWISNIRLIRSPNTPFSMTSTRASRGSSDESMASSDVAPEPPSSPQVHSPASAPYTPSSLLRTRSCKVRNSASRWHRSAATEAFLTPLLTLTNPGLKRMYRMVRDAQGAARYQSSTAAPISNIV